MQFLKINRRHLLRRRVEDFIKTVYAEEYGASINDFPALLVALVDNNSKPVCAAGLRFSGDGFFSERYLSQPIDRILDQAWASSVGREQIAEVTSLVGAKPGVSLFLIKHIVVLLRQRSVSWAFFTATERLRAILRRNGVPVLDIGQTSIDCVEDPDQWGGYYDTNPRVVAVHDSMLSISEPPPPLDAGVAISA
ncbi:MAG: thermostable hemolysin [Rhodospirillaceae bacterium]|nr:thermostable hemolysin [Rhodospirillaceae bacterium]MBL6929858.1 thermostable hemolysin [Rhodospirillales bacterium]MBL6941627.1 thermostable hemolysin [Rhodospirillales bacterium]